MKKLNHYLNQLNSAIDYAAKNDTFNFLNIIDSASNVILFGVGKYFEDAFVRQRVKERFHVTYLCDNNPDKWGKYYHGVRCISTDDVAALVERERETQSGCYCDAWRW